MTLFVEPFADGYRVTDQGSTAVRLRMTGVNLTASRVVQSWNRSVATLNLVNRGEEDLELAHFTSAEQLGEAIVKVAEANVRADQLHLLHSGQIPVRFPDRVVKRLSNWG